MAQFYSDAYNSGLMPDHTTPPGLVNCRIGSYTVTADMETGSIHLVPIPANCRIVDWLLMVEDRGSDGTIELGDTGSDSRFMNSGFTSEGTFRAGVDGHAGGLNHKYTSQTYMKATIGTSDLGSGATVTLIVWYKMTGSLSDET